MRTSVVIIGAGHAGLAMSRCLTDRAVDHVVLERGEVANSWKKERWDSLRLLTPNWQSRLPGHVYDGSDPDGYRTMPETIAFILVMRVNLSRSYGIWARAKTGLFTTTKISKEVMVVLLMPSRAPS